MLKALLLGTPILFGVAGASALFAATQAGGILINEDALVPLGVAALVLVAAVGAAWKLSNVFTKIIIRMDSFDRRLRQIEEGQ